MCLAAIKLLALIGADLKTFHNSAIADDVSKTKLRSVKNPNITRVFLVRWLIGSFMRTLIAGLEPPEPVAVIFVPDVNFTVLFVLILSVYVYPVS